MADLGGSYFAGLGSEVLAQHPPLTALQLRELALERQRLALQQQALSQRGGGSVSVSYPDAYRGPGTGGILSRDPGDFELGGMPPPSQGQASLGDVQYGQTISTGTPAMPPPELQAVQAQKIQAASDRFGVAGDVLKQVQAAMDTGNTPLAREMLRHGLQAMQPAGFSKSYTDADIDTMISGMTSKGTYSTLKELADIADKEVRNLQTRLESAMNPKTGTPNQAEVNDLTARRDRAAADLRRIFDRMAGLAGISQPPSGYTGPMFQIPVGSEATQEAGANLFPGGMIPPPVDNTNLLSQAASPFQVGRFLLTPR